MTTPREKNRMHVLKSKYSEKRGSGIKTTLSSRVCSSSVTRFRSLRSLAALSSANKFSAWWLRASATRGDSVGLLSETCV